MLGMFWFGYIDVGFGSLVCWLQNLQTSQKQEAAKNCNCTIADVENALAKFTWAKQAHKKLEKLKEEGKPIPKSMAEVLFPASYYSIFTSKMGLYLYG